MSQDEFTKLFKYMQKEFKNIDKRFDDQSNSINELRNDVDGYAKQAETYMQEMLAISHKMDRLERWINEIAEKTGVRLTY